MRGSRKHPFLALFGAIPHCSFSRVTREVRAVALFLAPEKSSFNFIDTNAGSSSISPMAIV